MLGRASAGGGAGKRPGDHVNKRSPEKANLKSQRKIRQ
jgi:hypothetical protein